MAPIGGRLESKSRMSIVSSLLQRLASRTRALQLVEGTKYMYGVRVSVAVRMRESVYARGDWSGGSEDESIGLQKVCGSLF